MSVMFDMHRDVRRLRRVLARVTLSCSRFGRDHRGVSAIEFALLVPLMIGLYVGCASIVQGVSIDRKVTVAARTIADLVAQVGSTTSSDVDTVLGAAAKIMEPYPPAGVAVSLIKIDTKGVAKIVWSRAKNGGPVHTKDEVVTVDAALKTPNTETYLVWGEAKYTYTPVVGFVFEEWNLTKASWPLNDQIFMRPRVSASVECSNCN